MAGISRREREDRQRIVDIKARLADPSLPHYLFAKLQGTLSHLQDKQDRRVAERKAKVTADRAARAEAAPKNWCVLPDNGRGRPLEAAPPRTVAPPDAGWPDLSYQGQ
jgi:hypothetical protein